MYKCYACGKEIEKPGEICPFCKFPVISTLHGKIEEEKQIKAFAEEYRKANPGIFSKINTTEDIIEVQNEDAQDELNSYVEPLLRRVFMSLENQEWQRANEFCDWILSVDYDNSQVYLAKLMAELHIRREEDFNACYRIFDDSINYQNLLKFGNDESVEYVSNINNRNKNIEIGHKYEAAIKLLDAANDEESYNAAASEFQKISGFKDADVLAEQCIERAEYFGKKTIYENAKLSMADNSIQQYELAIKGFQSIAGWEDADNLALQCIERLEYLKKEAVYENAKKAMAGDSVQQYEAAISAFQTISDWKDSNDLILVCQSRLEEIKAIEEFRRKDDVYKHAMSLMTGNDISHYRIAVDAFKSISGWKNSDYLIEKCQKIIEEIESSDEDKRAAVQELRKKHRRKVVFSIAAIIILVVMFFAAGKVIRLYKKNKAMNKIATGHYSQAYQLLAEIEDFDTIKKSKHDRAVELIEKSRYEEAYALLEEIGENDTIITSKYDRAIEHIRNKEYEEAYVLLEEIGDNDTIIKSKYDRAIEHICNKEYEEAYVLLEEIGDNDTIITSKHDRAIEFINNKEYEEAYVLLKEIGDKDTITKSKYDRAIECIASGDIDSALLLLRGLDYKDSAEKFEQCYIMKYGEALYELYEYYKNVEIGSYITFGSYEQNNSLADGKEDIEWLVLNKQGSSLYLVSKYALDSRVFDEDGTNTNWVTCSLREWLNTEFIQSAFNDEEQSQIIACAYDGIHDDKVSIPTYVDATILFDNDPHRQCKPTTYAIAHGAKGSYVCWWWLRTRDYDTRQIKYINSAGSIYEQGCQANKSGVGVRPAIWIGFEGVAH